MTISTATTKSNVVKIVFFIFLQILKKRPKDIDFLFVVDGTELKLIPPIEKEGIVMEWALSLMNDSNKRFIIEEDYLIGDSKETEEYY